MISSSNRGYSSSIVVPFSKHLHLKSAGGFDLLKSLYDFKASKGLLYKYTTHGFPAHLYPFTLDFTGLRFTIMYRHRKGK